MPLQHIMPLQHCAARVISNKRQHALTWTQQQQQPKRIVSRGRVVRNVLGGLRSTSCVDATSSEGGSFGWTNRRDGGREARRLVPRASIEQAPDASSNACKSLKLHLSDSTITLPLEEALAVEMKEATLKVFDLFKEKETWDRPRRLDQVKVKLVSSTSSANTTTTEISLFVNPNAYATAFQAKVLFSLKAPESGIEITTEIPLSKFKEDVDDFLKP